MVEQITKEEMETLWNNDEHARGMAFPLTTEQIESWKKLGKFKHLRRELENIPNIKFCCTQNKDGNCWYYFFTNSERMSNRISNLKNCLHEGNFVRITRVSSTRTTTIGIGNRIDVREIGKVCNMF